MPKYPSVTIAIPVYNGEKYLSETISSAISQDYNGILKVIAINDCSTDSSVDVLQHFRRFSPKKFQFISLDENEGLMSVNNRILKIVETDLILYLGQDDILPPSHLSTLVGANLVTNSVSAIWCNSNVIDENGKYVRRSLVPYKQKIKNIFTRLFISHTNYVSSTGMLISVAKLKQVGGWPQVYRNFGEWLLWIRLNSVGKIMFSEKATVLYRRHSNNLSNFLDDTQIPRDVAEYYKLCRTEAKTLLLNSWLNKISYYFFSLLRK